MRRGALPPVSSGVARRGDDRRRGSRRAPYVARLGEAELVRTDDGDKIGQVVGIVIETLIGMALVVAVHLVTNFQTDGNEAG